MQHDQADISNLWEVITKVTRGYLCYLIFAKPQSLGCTYSIHWCESQPWLGYN